MLFKANVIKLLETSNKNLWRGSILKRLHRVNDAASLEDATSLKAASEHLG